MNFILNTRGGLWVVVGALVAVTQTSRVEAFTQQLAPTSVVNDASVGSIDWGLGGPPPNVAIKSSPVTTHYAKFTGFGFSIPTDAVIERILVYVDRSSATQQTQDYSVRLVKAGVPVGADFPNGNLWLNVTETIQYYQSSTPLWGTSWTPAEINDSGFGIALSANILGGGDATSLGNVQIRVDYAGCPNTRQLICETYQKGSLVVDEKAGKEKISLKLDAGPTDVRQTVFGDPTESGGAILSVCIYGSDDALAGGLVVARAGETCNGVPCWSSKGIPYPDAKILKYGDKLQAADGVKSLQIKTEELKPKKITLKANNKLGTMPLGTAANLTGDTSATVQVFSSQVGFCSTLAITSVKEASTTKFSGKAVAP